MLEAALAAGIAAGGGDALLGGVLPTPAASILVRRLGLDLAAVVSASHNPWRDNGIKFFGRDGASSTTRPRRESRRPSGRPSWRAAEGRRPRAQARGRPRRLPARARAAFPLDLSGAQVLLDCANGADLPRRPGDLRAPRRRGRGDRRPSPTAATSTRAAARPTPRRSPSAWSRSGAEIGFAFDGDGDRVIAVDARRARPRRRRADRRSRRATCASAASSAAASRSR